MFLCFLFFLGAILLFVWFPLYLKVFLVTDHSGNDGTAECSLSGLPVMMLKKNNTQERHKNIYVTFARKYISSENKAKL